MPSIEDARKPLDFEQLINAERIPPIDNAKEAQITAHALALAALLSEETEAEKLKTFGGIEEAIREHMQTRVNPAVAIFLSHKAAKRAPGAAVRLLVVSQKRIYVEHVIRTVKIF